jgi:MoxR-like ATPase
MTPEHFTARFTAMVNNVEQVVRGKHDAVELALICLFAEGHLLIEDVPGVGKTTLARALAACLDGRLQRIQFTPDLLPSDVTGVSIYHPGLGAFQFHAGPVFANIVHADEINRASPKTQSALLEVMEERRVTIDGIAHPTPRPFMVIATQNPVDMNGTYPLPEAQLDRFLMRVTLGYPDHDGEVSILAGSRGPTTVDSLPPVLGPAELAELMSYVDNIYVADILQDYLVDVVAATRTAPGVRLGASPRASLALLRAAQVRAAAQSRTYVVPADVKALAVPVLSHRLVLTPEAELQSRPTADVIEAILASVPVPGVAVPARG